MGVTPGEQPSTAREPKWRRVRIALKVGVLLAVSVLSGYGSAHIVLARAVAQGKPEYEVRLASYMAGLFVAGVVATITGVAMLLIGRKKEGT